MDAIHEKDGTAIIVEWKTCPRRWNYRDNRAIALGERYLREFRKLDRAKRIRIWFPKTITWSWPAWILRTRPYDQEFDDA